jgi:hypothetical protein
MNPQTLHLVLRTCLNFGRLLAGKCRSCGSHAGARGSEPPGHPEGVVNSAATGVRRNRDRGSQRVRSAAPPQETWGVLGWGPDFP